MADYITDIIARYEADFYKVKQYGLTLQFVKKQTFEVCLAAVKKNGLTLQVVNEQTPELCLAAVKQYGWALKLVKDIELKEKIRLELKL